MLGNARAEGITGWERQALNSLLVDPIVIGKNDDDPAVWFVNGKHRTRAMRDAGVTEVLVEAQPQVGTVIGPPRAGQR